MADPRPKYARLNAQDPSAWGQCDRCGFWYNLRNLTFQQEWAGTHLYNLGVLVCDRCLDVPQEQLRTIILPPDPPPMVNARPPNLTIEEDGPVQSILTATVLKGGFVLPLESVAGFNIDDAVWIQFTNGRVGEEFIVLIDPVANTITIQAPLPETAPIYGVVSFSRNVPGGSYLTEDGGFYITEDGSGHYIEEGS